MSNPSAKLAELRSPVERLDHATDLLEAAMHEVATLEDSEMRFYIGQAANVVQRKRRDIGSE